GLADGARHAVEHALARIDGHRVSAVPHPGGVLLLGKNGKFPAAAIPTVGDATRVDGKTLADLQPACPPTTAAIGTWCLEESPYPLLNKDAGYNDWFWASRKCVEAGGFLPSAGDLIGAARRVKLAGKIHESVDTATIEQDPTVGLKDKREMSS